MITDNGKWHYLALKSERIIYGENWCNHAVRSSSRLLRGKTSNHNEDFYCFNYHSYSTETRLKKHEEVCNKHDYFPVDMPNEFNKALEYRHGKKLLKFPFIIYIDLDCLLKITHSCINSPEKSYTEKKARHEPSRSAITVKSLFDGTTNKYDYYRERDCIEKLCKKLKDRGMEINNCKEKEIIPLTNKENKFYK